MVESFKSVVFVAAAVMIALVLQAQAASLSSDDATNTQTAVVSSLSLDAT